MKDQTTINPKTLSAKKLALLPLLATLSMPGLALSSQDIEIIEPYARAVTAAQSNSAVFMRLRNNSDKEHKIINAKGNVSSVVELHTHVNDNGVMRMRKVNEISIPPNSTTELKPGGLHIMLIGLDKGLNVGDKVELEIEFADNSKAVINAPVKNIKRMANMDHGSHGAKGHGHKGSNNKQMVKHTNPMPNLMKVITKHGDQLQLSKEQDAALAKWRKSNHKKVHGMMSKVQKLEAELNEAGLSGKSKADIIAMADDLMAVRKSIIEAKTNCRDNMKSVLTPEQFSKVIAMYKNMMASDKGQQKKHMH